MKGVVIQALLAVLGLVAAYLVWTEKDIEGAVEGGVTILTCGTRDLQRVTLSGQNVVTALYREDGVWWAEERQVPRKVAGEGSADQATPDVAGGVSAEGAEGNVGEEAGELSGVPSEAPVSNPAETDTAEMDAVETNTVETTKAATTIEAPPPNNFVVNESADTYLDRFRRLQALRGLGKLSEEQLAALGFDGPELVFEVECKSVKRSFRVGGSTFGTGDRYLKDLRSQEIFLVDAEVIKGVESAKFRLMQREMHRFELSEVEKVVVSALGQQRTLLHRDRLKPELESWVDVDAPDRRNELYANWLDRVGKLRAQSYLGPGIQPEQDVKDATGSQESVVQIRYLDKRENVIGELELVRVPGEQVTYFARSDTTQRWVKVLRSVAQQIADDVPTIMGDAGGSSAAKTPSTTP